MSGLLLIIIVILLGAEAQVLIILQWNLHNKWSAVCGAREFYYKITKSGDIKTDVWWDA